MLRSVVSSAANALLLLFLAAGCVPDDTSTDEAEEEGLPSATGQWAGGVMGLTLELILVELENKNLSGTGTARGANGSANLVVDSGTHRHPKIDLTLSASLIDSLVLTGKFEDDDEIRGQANGSGFVKEPFTLVRE